MVVVVGGGAGGAGGGAGGAGGGGGYPLLTNSSHLNCLTNTSWVLDKEKSVHG